MSAFDLPRVPPPPPPPEPKRCVACKDFRAECLVPAGEGSAPMCWLCAHHVVDHECKLEDAPAHECECLPHQIYPGRDAPKTFRFPHGDVTREMIEKATPEELLRGSSFSDACAERMRKAVAVMTPAQRNMLSNGVLHTRAEPCRDGFRGAIERTKGVPATKLWVDEPKKRVCHCGICAEEGHYAKTCPRRMTR